MSAPARPALVVLAGLPGVGKTTIARLLAPRIGAVHLRIDTIESALLRREVSLAGPRGDLAYVIAYAQARDLLGAGARVVVDAVHGWPGAQELWSEAARESGAPVVVVNLACADRDTHRARVTGRRPDLPGLVLPDWPAVTARAYRAHPAPALTLDTTTLSPAVSAARIARHLESLNAGKKCP